MDFLIHMVLRWVNGILVYMDHKAHGTVEHYKAQYETLVWRFQESKSYLFLHAQLCFDRGTEYLHVLSPRLWRMLVPPKNDDVLAPPPEVNLDRGDVDPLERYRPIGGEDVVPDPWKVDPIERIQERKRLEKEYQENQAEKQHTPYARDQRTLLKKGRGRGSSRSRCRPAPSPVPDYTPTRPLVYATPPKQLSPKEIDQLFRKNFGEDWNSNGLGLPSGHTGLENDPIMIKYQQEQLQVQAAEFRATVRREAAERKRLEAEDAQRRQEMEQRLEIAKHRYIRQVNKLAAYGPKLDAGLDSLVDHIYLSLARSNYADLKTMAQNFYAEILTPVDAIFAEMREEIALEVEGAEELRAQWPCDRLAQLCKNLEGDSRAAQHFSDFVADIRRMVALLENAKPWVNPLQVIHPVQTDFRLQGAALALPVFAPAPPQQQPSESLVQGQTEEVNFPSFAAMAAATQPSIQIPAAGSSSILSAAAAKPTGRISFGAASASSSSAPGPSTSPRAPAASAAGPASSSLANAPPLSAAEPTPADAVATATTKVRSFLSRFRSQSLPLLSSGAAKMFLPATNLAPVRVEARLRQQILDALTPLLKHAGGYKGLVAAEFEQRVYEGVKKIRQKMDELCAEEKEGVMNNELLRVLDGCLGVWRVGVGDGAFVA